MLDGAPEIGVVLVQTQGDDVDVIRPDEEAAHPGRPSPLQRLVRLEIALVPEKHDRDGRERGLLEPECRRSCAWANCSIASAQEERPARLRPESAP